MIIKRSFDFDRNLDIGSLISLVSAVGIAWYLGQEKQTESSDCYTQTDNVTTESIDRSSQTETCSGVDETLEENRNGPLVADAVVDKIQQASVFR